MRLSLRFRFFVCAALIAGAPGLIAQTPRGPAQNTAARSVSKQAEAIAKRHQAAAKKHVQTYFRKDYGSSDRKVESIDTQFEPAVAEPGGTERHRTRGTAVLGIWEQKKSRYAKVNVEFEVVTEAGANGRTIQVVDFDQKS